MNGARQVSSAIQSAKTLHRNVTRKAQGNSIPYSSLYIDISEPMPSAINLCHIRLC